MAYRHCIHTHFITHPRNFIIQIAESALPCDRGLFDSTRHRREIRILTPRGVLVLRERLALCLDLYSRKISPLESVYCINKARRSQRRVPVRMTAPLALLAPRLLYPTSIFLLPPVLSRGKSWSFTHLQSSQTLILTSDFSALIHRNTQRTQRTRGCST